METRKVGFGFVIGLIVGLTVATVAAGTRPSRQEELIEKFFSPIAWLIDEIDTRYVEEVDTDILVRGAYEGILSKLDDYSTYIPPDRLEEFEADTKGAFGGLGITIRYLPIKKVVLVEQAIPGTPAFRAGLASGDMIVEVVDSGTGDKTMARDLEDVHDAVRILRGKPGTSVDLLVAREDGQVREVTVERAIIKIPGVRDVHMINEEKGIGYVYVPYFHEQTVSDLRKALAQLQEQGARGVILDLRFNPGGLLQAAVQFADLFLDGKEIVSTRGRNTQDQPIYARRGDRYPNLSVVLLVNRYSASASEIVAAALSENGRAAIVGESTFGKASVQTLIEDERYTGGALKLTTAHYYTPQRGLLIQGEGVSPDPDRLLKLSDEDMMKLRLALARTTSFPPEPAEDEPEQEKTTDEEGTEAPADGEVADGEDPLKDFVDEQLQLSVRVMEDILSGAPIVEPAAVQSAAVEE